MKSVLCSRPLAVFCGFISHCGVELVGTSSEEVVLSGPRTLVDLSSVFTVP